MSNPKAPCPISMPAMMPRSAHCARSPRATVIRGTSVSTVNQDGAVVPVLCTHSIRRAHRSYRTVPETPTPLLPRAVGAAP